MSYIQSEQKKKKRKDRSNRHSKISLAFFQLPIKAISATKQCHFFLFPVKLWSVFQLPPIVWLRTAEGLEPQAKYIIHCLKKKKKKIPLHSTALGLVPESLVLICNKFPRFSSILLLDSMYTFTFSFHV